MSRKSLVPVNVPALASAPSTPTIRTGDLYFNTTDQTLYSYNGTTWAASSGGGGGASVTIATSAPSSPTAGSLWFDSDTGQFFIYYSNYWMEVGAGGSAAPQAIISQASAPSDTSALWLDTDEPAVETIPASIVDAKGDIVIATGDNVPARLPIGTDGAVLMANSNVSAGMSWVNAFDLAGKNKLINGAFDIWQRGTSFTSDAVYTADRWISSMQTGQATVSQATSSLPTGFKNAIKIQRNASSSSTSLISISQSLETLNSIPLQGKTVVLSFWAKKGASFSDAAGQIFVRMYSGTGTDQNAASYGAWTGYTEWHNASAVTPTTSWVRYSVTGTVPSTATQVGIRLGFGPTGTAGSDDSFHIAGVQLELGSVATPFSQAGSGYGGELALCQRYYQRKTVNTNYARFGSGQTVSTTNTYSIINLNVPLRTAPTALEYSNLGVWDGTNVLTVTLVSIGESAPTAVTCNVTVASGLTVNRPMDLLANNNVNAYIAFGAEL